MKKKCDKCGAAFDCAHSKDCWCMSFTFSEEAIEEMKSKYKDCLCENCLSEYGKARGGEDNFCKKE